MYSINWGLVLYEWTPSPPALQPGWNMEGIDTRENV